MDVNKTSQNLEQCIGKYCHDQAFEFVKKKSVGHTPLYDKDYAECVSNHCINNIKVAIQSMLSSSKVSNEHKKVLGDMLKKMTDKPKLYKTILRDGYYHMLSRSKGKN